ncbi:uncharacterized protein SOCE26_010760 [Sorangium cellulosum]|uniref:Secreted protein n=2 Tax=Sorangium cellulosum TaxID=56 RepID=A0A2L0EK60_SORCE|nr:uncharacterized protein SOCE26_010760 [Sorangium cellulosum]
MRTCQSTGSASVLLGVVFTLSGMAGCGVQTTSSTLAEDQESAELNEQQGAETSDATASADIDGAGLGESSEALQYCPPPSRPMPGEICTQVITWARSPRTGMCCRYATPCHAPEGWATFFSLRDCRRG